MVVKFIGSALLMGASVLWGAYMASREYFRLKDLREMQRAYAVLRQEIDYGMSQLGEAAMNAASKCSGPARDMLLYFADNLSGKLGPWQVWNDAVEYVADSSYFSGEDLEIFKTFGKTLGYLDKEMQVHTIDMQVDYIESKLDELEVSWQKTRKMYLSLGVLGGMMAVILLV